MRFANLCAAESVKHEGGSLAAPCWRDLGAFWDKLEDTEAAPGVRVPARRYSPSARLDRPVPERARRCRRPPLASAAAGAA